MSVKTLALKPQGHSTLLAAGENPFSGNKVTGHSLNLPIVATCRPTTVCADTCYFARGPSTWRQSLDKQYRLLNSMTADPRGMAEQIARWAAKLRMTFVRWNGGGDLTEPVVDCLNHAAGFMPDIPQWVVTRKPEMAARVTPQPNVYLHFLTDRSSLPRLRQMRQAAQPGLQWFFSYQCDPGETPETDAPVVFRDKYRLTGEAVPGDCPLNLSESIQGVCETCRRCFNGEAVARMPAAAHA